jgi:hypothetical protein
VNLFFFFFAQITESDSTWTLIPILNISRIIKWVDRNCVPKKLGFHSKTVIHQNKIRKQHMNVGCLFNVPTQLDFGCFLKFVLFFWFTEELNIPPFALLKHCSSSIPNSPNINNLIHSWAKFNLQFFHPNSLF